jgi:protein-S-isoprenylcysteine O-methyltransferase Ste14
MFQHSRMIVVAYQHIKKVKKMASLFLRNLFFTILQPGIVAGLIPFFILRGRMENIFYQPREFHHAIGMIVFVIGFIIMLACIISFAINGRGTLSPADPTKKLVVVGLYKFSRNPMYVGVTMMLLGEVIFFYSSPLLIYSLWVFTVFNVFIIFVEEPRLRKDFKDEYNKYCEKVKRWV